MEKIANIEYGNNHIEIITKLDEGLERQSFESVSTQLQLFYCCNLFS